MTDVSTIVSIARGRGMGTGEELGLEMWQDFKDDVWRLVRQQCGLPVADGEGSWHYQDSETGAQREDNYILVAGEFPFARAAFEAQLAKLAHEYSQDTIAVTYAVPSFIGAR